MAYEQKTWVNRVSEHPARRKLMSTETEGVFDVSREEGLVTAAGDAFSAGTMNNLEGRISSAFGVVETEISTISGNVSSVSEVANAALPKAGGTLTGQVTAGGAQVVGTAQIRNVYAGTSAMTAGVTALATGSLYFQYQPN